jgi:magnesium-transporting ATPase (P-type)
VALKAEVRRDGAFQAIEVDKTVPGDVLRVRSGDLIPADALILENTAFTAGEAALTGEPYPVEKRAGVVAATTPGEASNALFQGAVAQSGEAIALAVNTGRSTVFGAAASALVQAQAPRRGWGGQSTRRPAWRRSGQPRRRPWLPGHGAGAWRPRRGERLDSRGPSRFRLLAPSGVGSCDGCGRRATDRRGAPEAVLALCVAQRSGEMSAPTTDNERGLAIDRVHALAQDGVRTIAVASRPWSGPTRNIEAADEKSLVLESMTICGVSD